MGIRDIMPRFENNYYTRQRQQQEIDAFNMQRDELHKQAFLEDLRTMNRFAERGDVNAVAHILEQRVNTLQKHGGDYTESLGTLRMLQSGNPEQIGAALADLAQAEVIANAGMMANPKPDQYLERDGGQGIYQRPDGSLYSRQVEGYSEKPDPKETASLIKNHRDAIKDLTKDMRLVDVSYSKMKNSAQRKTAAGDMSLIFGIMKMNDPGSTVREGEYATAQQAGSLNQQFISFYNSALNGQKLSQEQRDDFVAQAGALYNAQRQNTDIQIGNILQQADQDGLDRVRLLGADRYKEFTERMQKYGQQPGDDSAQKPTAPAQKPVVIEFGDLPDA